MSLELALSRIAELRRVYEPPIVAQPMATAAPAATPAASPTFASTLDQAQASLPAGVGARVAAAARREVGQRESPLGSNDSPRISQYRATVPGGPVGPWCAYFASWASAQAGSPLGDNGQGFARVDDVWAWGQRTGRATTVASGARPQPGDLIIWDEHMGIVDSVGPDGSIKTIEGNSSDAVSSRTYGPDGGGAIGFVRPGPTRTAGPAGASESPPMRSASPMATGTELPGA